MVDFGYLKTVETKQLVFETEYDNDPTITLSYIFYGRNNTIISMGTREMDLTAVPDEFSLHQNYPNPFNPNCTINFQASQRSEITIQVYNLAGQLVLNRTQKIESIGLNKWVWNGTSDTGNRVGSGIYLLQISDGISSSLVKIILAK